MTKYWISAEKSVDITDAEDVNVVHFSVDDKNIAVSGGQTIFEALQRMPGIGEISGTLLQSCGPPLRRLPSLHRRGK